MAAWQQREDTEARTVRTTRGREVRDALSTYEQVGDGGVTYFQLPRANPAPPEDGSGRAAVVCAGCQAQLALEGPYRPAAICGCGLLHFAEVRFVGRYLPMVETFPTEGADIR